MPDAPIPDPLKSDKKKQLEPKQSTSAVSQDDDDTSSEDDCPKTPADFKRERTNALRNLTRLSTKIEVWISGKISRTFLKMHEKEFGELYELCVKANSDYRMSAHHTSKELEKISAWEQKLNSQSSIVSTKVNDYFELRKDDAPSEHSHRSLQSASVSAAKERTGKLLQSEFDTNKKLAEVKRLKEQLDIEYQVKEVALKQEEEKLREDLQQTKLTHTIAKLTAEDSDCDDQAEDLTIGMPFKESLLLKTSSSLPQPFPKAKVDPPNSRSAVTFSKLKVNHDLSRTNPVFSRPTSTDSWIADDPDTVPASSLPTSTRHYDPRIAARLPRITLKPFSGDVKDWPLFHANFKSLVHDTVADDAQRYAILTESLSDKVKRGITLYLGNSAYYPHILAALKKRYGHPYLIAQSHLSALHQLPTVKESNPSSLIEFSAELSGAVGALVAAGFEHELSSTDLLSRITQKLTTRLREAWGERVFILQPRSPTVVDLEEWIDRKATAASFNFPLQVDLVTTRPDTSGKTRQPSLRKPGDKVFSYAIEVAEKGEKATACSFCGGGHSSEKCFRFKKMNPEDKAAISREKNVCYRCLNNNHRARDCSRTDRCGIGGCSAVHHPLLHGAPRLYPKVSFNPSSAKESGTSSTVMAVSSVSYAPAVTANPTILLAVINLWIESGGRRIRTKALLDRGSQATLVRSDLTKALGLFGPKETLTLHTVNGNDGEQEVQSVTFSISSLSGSSRFDVQHAFAVENLNITQSAVDLNAVKREWRHLADITFEERDSISIGILLGLDVLAAHDILETRKPSDGKDGPWATLTPFGWCLIGPVNSTRPKQHTPVHRVVNHIAMSQQGDVALHELVSNFNTLEAMGIKTLTNQPVSAADDRALAILNGTISNVGNRYQVGLMWCEDDVRLPDNKLVALRRLFCLESRFKRDSLFASSYASVINEYINLGHARKLDSSELLGKPGKVWYLPHHGVVHPAKPDRPRVVFDGSAEFLGVSLNSKLLKGPNLLMNLIDLLIYFRLKRIPVSADIAKMYHQVLAALKDRDCLRFLWREPGSSLPPDVYQMLVHIFGAVSSPTTCIFALQKTAKDNRAEFPDIADRFIKRFYVDNYLDSTDTEEEAIDLCKRMTSLSALGGFQLTKWQSSSRRVLSSITSSERCHPNLDLDLDKLPIDRTLGMLWDVETDTFQFHIKPDENTCTKREVLRTVASIFDPLGFVNPVVLQARIILQDIWRSGTDWDEPILEPILKSWKKWCSDLIGISRIRIRRWCRQRIEEPTCNQLHVFVDASEKGFGATAYLRTLYQDGKVDVSLISAKSRVAPLVHLSIPRLELQGAVTGLRLAAAMSEPLQLDKKSVYFWTDSQTVLQWINSTSCRFSVFVANRIGEILEGSSRTQWRHVSGKDNPADDCSRGLTGAELTSSHRWFKGPAFLHLPVIDWPKPNTTLEPLAEDPEVLAPRWCGLVKPHSTNGLQELINKSSNWTRVLRTVAWALRFADNSRLKTAQRQRTPWLLAAEFQRSWRTVIKVCQAEMFRDEIHALTTGKGLPAGSSLANLSPFLGPDGLLRVRGRLDFSDLPYGQKYPVILNQSHHLSKLVIHHVHDELHHPGLETTFAGVRRNYWVIGGRSTIRHVVGNCFICKKKRAVPLPPLMAAVPRHRLESSGFPFNNIGVDYFGPFYVTIHRRKHKRYGCIFTCLRTRAVHLEVSHSLDQDSFLLAFSRFTGRRGVPSVVYSDNGTNLVAGEREIRETIAKWNQTAIGDKLAAQNVNWIFSPPAAPHFGGVWERLVQSAKRALQAVLKERDVTDEILSSAFVEAEHLINSRPLTHVSVDPNDPSPLTPNHFLIGRASSTRPFDQEDPSDYNLRKRYRYVQLLINHFWQRWMTEYVPGLIERRKWLTDRRNVQAGDVVLIADPNNARGSWPIGWIVRAIPSKDGIIRKAVVRTSSGEYTRPVHKLCILETFEEKPSPRSQFST